MTGLLLYSDEPVVAAAIAERLPGVTRRPVTEMADRPTAAPSLAVRRAPCRVSVVTAGCAELLVAALRVVGVPARSDGDPAPRTRGHRVHAARRTALSSTAARGKEEQGHERIS